MTYQVQYNTKTSQAFLQMLIVLMDNESVNYEYFNELTGLSITTYKDLMHDMEDIVQRLNLGKLMKRDIDIIEKGTAYKIYEYKLVCVDNQAFDYYQLSEEERIKFSLGIIYLKLKNRHYVAYDSLEKIFPNFTRKTFMNAIEKMREVIAEDLFKDEFQSYIIEDFE